MIVYDTSQCKRFSNINITKKLAKENTVFNLTVYFNLSQRLVFSLKHTKTLKIKNSIESIQYLTFFSFFLIDVRNN